MLKTNYVSVVSGIVATSRMRFLSCTVAAQAAPREGSNGWWLIRMWLVVVLTCFNHMAMGQY